MGHINNSANHNRKLTPSKGSIGIRANSALNNNMSHTTAGRAYEQQIAANQKAAKSKVNNRSNTIEVLGASGNPSDKSKGIKHRKERSSQNHSIDGLFTKNQNLNYNK